MLTIPLSSDPQDDHVSMRTVSADTPSWFQIPGVNIGKLNADQLRMLMEWKAPIPRSSMDASLKQSLEGSTDRARMYAKHQNCPFNCSHIGCAQVKTPAPLPYCGSCFFQANQMSSS